MTKYKTLCALSIKGTRVEKGVVIELDEDFAKGLMSDLTKVESEVESVEEKEVEESAEEDINEMTISELKAKATELGLSTKGTKADLIERISLAEKPEGDDAE